MKRILPLVFLISVFVISGCVKQDGSGGGGTNDGISISSFIADPSPVEGGDHVYLLMDIENKGGDVARGIQARIIGLPTGTNGFSGNLGSPTGLPNELYPPEAGMSGEVATLEWDIVTPESQTDIEYPAEAEIQYSYLSHVETLVRIANREWLRSLPPDERSTESGKQGKVEGGVQNGPIHATIKPSTSTASRLILDIQNVAGGLLPNDEIKSVTVSGMSCSGLTNPVKLIRGKSKQFRCEPSQDVSETERWKNIRIDVDLDYDYIVKRPVTIKVLRKPL